MAKANPLKFFANGSFRTTPIDTGELAALIGVYQHLCLGFASPDRHEQGLQDDVRHPDPIPRFDVELPVESIGDYDRRLAAIAAWTPLVADLPFSNFGRMPRPLVTAADLPTE
jgi:hypothetical protein